MSTTTIRLPEELESRVAQAAQAAGTTSHNFVLEAIAEKVALAEQPADFHAVADQRYALFLESGESVPLGRRARVPQAASRRKTCACRLRLRIKD